VSLLESNLGYFAELAPDYLDIKILAFGQHPPSQQETPRALGSGQADVEVFIVRCYRRPEVTHSVRRGTAK
jgi:hypothetical protein